MTNGSNSPRTRSDQLTLQNNEPFLSVVVPTYNRRGTLRIVLESLSKQKNTADDDVELVIVDDGSVDGTCQLVECYQTISPIVIRYFRQDNRGPASARNKGIKEARGDVVLFIGDDVMGSSDFLYQHIHWHKYHFPPSNIAVLGNSPMVDNNYKSTIVQEWLNRKQMAYQNLQHMQEASYEYFYTCNISLKRNFLLENGFFNESYRQAAGEDTELGYRLSKAGLKLYYNAQALAYHLHPMTVLEFIHRYFKLGKSKEVARKTGNGTLAAWTSSRCKISPFRVKDPIRLAFFAALYLASLAAFSLGRLHQIRYRQS